MGRGGEWVKRRAKRQKIKVKRQKLIPQVPLLGGVRGGF
jgi:hypothetical protein